MKDKLITPLLAYPTMVTGKKVAQPWYLSGGINAKALSEAEVEALITAMYAL